MAEPLTTAPAEELVRCKSQLPLQKASLLGIPAETRLEIFFHILRSDGDQVDLNPHNHLFRSDEQASSALLQHPLFHVNNSQIYREAVEALVLANTFLLRDNRETLFFHKFLGSISLANNRPNQLPDSVRDSTSRLDGSNRLAIHSTRLIDIAAPSTTGLAWVRSLCFEPFHKDGDAEQPTQLDVSMALIKACTGLKHVGVVIKREAPAAERLASVWSSFARACTEGSSLETLTIDLKFSLIDYHQVCWMRVLRAVVEFGNSWIKQTGAKKLKTVGKLWGLESAELEKLSVSRANQKAGTQEPYLVAAEWLFREEGLGSSL